MGLPDQVSSQLRVAPIEFCSLRLANPLPPLRSTWRVRTVGHVLPGPERAISMCFAHVEADGTVVLNSNVHKNRRLL